MKRTFSSLFAILSIALTVLSCSSDDNTISESSFAEITGFTLTFNGVNPEEVLYKLRTNITVSVPFGTSLNDVIPTITLEDNASVSPASGQALNFVEGEPKIFVVTAEDGTSKEYTVTINQRGEIGSGSRLESYTISDLYGENSISMYSYNEANFVKEISKEADDWGDIITTLTTFEYNDKNQIIAESIVANEEKTLYTYEEDVIVKSEYFVESKLVHTYDYSYNEAGDLATMKKTDHSDDSVDEIKYIIENGNVIEELRYGDLYVATYDDKNNPFIGMYPSAYAAINVGIQFINVNNPVSGTIADAAITYEYNDDNYPISSSYTYFDNLATVDKTFTYFNE